MFAWLRRGPDYEAVARVYELIVTQSRRPEFYRDLAVADSLDGRFDMLSLHAMLVLRRLKQEPARTHRFSQGLFDHMFKDMDMSLREIGVGDLSVGKRVKQMSSAFLGRIVAYEKGLSEGDEALVDALTRNVYREQAPEVAVLQRLADYVLRVDERLTTVPLTAILTGEKAFEDSVP
jgi:cytochrome b pre-mRNA-processing protein 3